MRFQVSKEVWLRSYIEIERNQSGIGKRYIARQYKDGNLVASYPANELSEIDLSFFEEQPWN